MIHADETMVTPNKFLFPENSDKHGIPRDAQPALPYRAVRRRDLTGYAGLSHIRSTGIHPLLSA